MKYEISFMFGIMGCHEGSKYCLERGSDFLVDITSQDTTKKIMYMASPIERPKDYIKEI